MKVYESIFSPEIRDFLSMRQKSVSRSAYEHDIQTLELFDRYLCSVGHTDKTIDEHLAVGWINTLTGRPRTIAEKVKILRKFLDFLSGYGIKVFIPTVPKVHDDYVPYIFSDDELERIFLQADTCPPVNGNSKYPLIHLQMPMILRLMYGCGMRIGETVSIKMKDIDLETGLITLRHTKGDKQRIVPMHDTLTDILYRYCCAAGLIGSPDAFVFGVPHSNNAIPAVGAKYRFEKILGVSGIDIPGRSRHERGACLHCLRHIFAFKAFRQADKMGVRIDDAVPYLSIYLGHNSLAETQKYLKFNTEIFPDVLDRFGDFTSNIFPEVEYEE